jgi:[protein-PII] uridylyltransferase
VGRPGPGAGQLEGILSLLRTPATPEDLRSFLDGLPRRYLAVHSLEEVAEHFQQARRIAEAPVQVELRTHLHLHELTVVTPDRPFLFASITGTLSAWGMNIVKAEAFANTAGIVLDTFRFADLYRTLEMNPPERERLKANLVEVLNGKLPLEKLMSGRINAGIPAKTKIQVSPRVWFDRASSSHSTLLELIAPDRPGLLYQISSTLATLGCNIEIALIDTEGQKAIDVFYLTCRGAKLDPAKEQELREALLPLL